MTSGKIPAGVYPPLAGGNEKYMSEIERPEVNSKRNFEVEVVQHSDGPSYKVYFPSEDAAAQAITDFWNSRVGSEQTVRGIRSGMLNPRNPSHTITDGDRTRIGTLGESDQQKYPDMTHVVWFNGNETAISSRGGNALVRLGFVESKED